MFLMPLLYKRPDYPCLLSHVLRSKTETKVKRGQAGGPNLHLHTYIHTHTLTYTLFILVSVLPDYIIIRHRTMNQKSRQICDIILPTDRDLASRNDLFSDGV